MKVLITGGTGLVGKKLTTLLLSKGYDVVILSRSKKESKIPGLTYAQWNLATKTIDENAVLTSDYIIHLAGAGIADARWTSKRKKVIIESRVLGLNLIYDVLSKNEHQLKALVSASGIGYYGMLTKSEVFDENTALGNDFLAEVCHQWEKAALQFENINIKTTVLRTGVVFAKEGSALQKIVQPIQMYVGAPLGGGNQVLPYIHIDDLCNMYIHALENDKVQGIYNAVDENISNKDLTELIAKEIDKPLFLPNVPSFVLQLVFGKMAGILLKGTAIDNTKIKATGFTFQYKTIAALLKSVL